MDVKHFFPALASSPLVYLDSAATTQMPLAVFEAQSDYVRSGRGNPYRGLHAFAEGATQAFNSARSVVAQFIGASPDELIFTKSTTEGLNLLARSLGSKLGPGDEVVLSIFEHHANLLPWRELAREHGFLIRYLSMSAGGSIDLEVAKAMMSTRTKAVVVAHVSNVLGTILPVKELGELAHAVGAVLLLDGAQSVAHMPVNVKELGCDAFAFGAHKMYGPEGIGALYIAKHLRPLLQPFVYGGGMVDEVLDDGVTYADDVRFFEAGSPNVSGAVGFAAACTFLLSQDFENIQRHEHDLVQALVYELTKLPRVTVHFPQPEFGRTSVVSFSIHGVHSHDVAQVLADQGIAVRAGYHCAAPLTRCLDVSGTVRASFGIYTSNEDVMKLVAGVRYVLARFV
jgi:cysteine desulfurase/selenocysteine lyase